MIIYQEDRVTVVISKDEKGYSMYCNLDCKWKCFNCKYGRKALKAFREHYDLTLYH